MPKFLWHVPLIIDFYLWETPAYVLLRKHLRGTIGGGGGMLVLSLALPLEPPRINLYVRCMRSAGIISAFVLSVILGSVLADTAQAKPNESIVCKSVKHCIDLVERHAPDSFDYQVLNSEFQRFGPPGKTALINMLASKDETDMRRAQAVLARGDVLLTPDEQRKIAALWPRGDVETHAKIMKSALSPLMRARLINTLSDDNPKVRTLSRDLLAQTVAMGMDFPLKPADFGQLSRALLVNPTPALVELMSKFEPARTSPIFTRLLRSTDGPTLSAAYEKLYEQNPETAFKALVATLYGLKDDQDQAAFALSYVLRQRHTSREDGFYLNFAKDLAEDPEMSLMGRLAGFDAIMQSETAPILSEPSKFRDVIELALQKHDSLPVDYLRNMPRQAAANSDMWLTTYWKHLRPRVSDQKLDFIRLVGGFETETAKNILMQGLGDQGDWRVIQAAALPLGRMGHKAAAAKLDALTDHPIMAVQIASLTALDGIKTGKMTGRPSFWQKQLTSQSGYCSATPVDFKDEAKSLPFFDLVDLEFKAGGDKRRFVSAIAPTKDGYVVGFDAGRNGGDLRYYDNVSGDSLALKSKLSEKTGNITAIMPVTPAPLGQYASAFWIVAEDGALTDQAKLYRLSTTDGAFKIKYQAELPHRVSAFAPQPNGDIFMSFYKKGAKPTDVNPPLILSPNGAIRRACTGATDTADALP